jgi:membrane-bound metal-dependent hydrolase YbcI (DUF457 family)
MYTGHIAVALATGREPRRVPILALLLASQAPDWIQLFSSVITDPEHAQLWSHSIPAVVIGATVVGASYLLATRDRRGAGLLALGYLSHPILDLITGSKPLWPGGPPFGACVYNHPPLDWAVECAVLFAGWLVYRTALVDDTTTFARRKRLAFRLLIGLVLCQTGVDLWQSFRIFRAPDVAACTEAAGRAPRPNDTRLVLLTRRSEPPALHRG